MPFVTDIDTYIGKEPAMTDTTEKKPTLLEQAALRDKIPVAPRKAGAARAATPMAMIDKALSSNAAPETLSKLMDLQERWEAGQARKAFDEAMAAARAELKPILKQQTATRGVGASGRDAGSYQYEDMAAVAAMVDPIFGKLGLNYRFTSRVDASQVYVTCLLSGHGHREEGATLSAGLDASGSKNSVQALGSTASYLERYTLKLSVGLAAAKDDDAQSANGKRTDEMQPISADQYQELKDYLEAADRDQSQLMEALGFPPDHDMHTISVGNYNKGMTICRGIITKEGRNAPAKR